MASAAQAALPARAPSGFLRRRLIMIAVAAIALTAFYMLWFRDSSLVGVRTVHIEGVPSGDTQLRDALTAAAGDMTTLHVRTDVLEQAAEPFPLVGSVSADPSFPSTLTIQVTERRPVALIGEGSDAVAVAADGTVLRGLPAGDLHLPRLPISEPPKRDRLIGVVDEQAQVLGAAPAAILRYIERSFNGETGVGVELDGGVELLFGNGVRADEKWRAAAAVLSDPDLGPLDYVDLSVPGRPAVGGSGYAPPPLSSG
jgi:cell division protein FtsQ